MTVQKLIAILSAFPSNATIVDVEDHTITIDEIIYNDYYNTVTFASANEVEDIPDDVDETNYDPYCGCDMFEICGSIDEEW